MNKLPGQLVLELLNEYRATGTYLRDRIDQIAELTASGNGQVAEAATRALFTRLVEPLADSFEPGAVSLYNRAMAQVIQACRTDPRASLLDQELNRLGFQREEDLLARADRLRNVQVRSSLLQRREYIKRVIVLSRVTLGADVAITSVIIQRMKQGFPGADIVLLGGSKAVELFGGDSGVQFEEISYRRAGNTIERLLTWVDLLRCISELTDGLTQQEYLIVDPDSRLTQLGLLPVGASQSGRETAAGGIPAQDQEYLFFPSREYGTDTVRSLGELACSWLDAVFDERVQTFPCVSLRSADVTAARKLLGRSSRGLRPIISINFGVGENQLKRVGGEFEATLVSRLIQGGASIILDKGAGDTENARADVVIAEARRVERSGNPARVVELDEQSLVNVHEAGCLDAEMLVWNGRIGVLAALIGESDQYIGYDSAGQHIAAALGVKCIDVFAGFSSPRMLDRWRPTGRAETRIVTVDTVGGGFRPSEVVEWVVSNSEAMLRGRDKGGKEEN